MRNIFSLLCIVHVACAFRIVSQETTSRVINGHSRLLHVATIECDETDDQIAHNMTVGDGAHMRTVEFRCEQPQEVFDSSLMGWIPRVQYPVFARTCIVQRTSDNNTLQHDQFTSSASRRLLSLFEDDMPEHTAGNRKLLWTKAQTYGIGIGGGVGIAGGAIAIGVAAGLSGAAALGPLGLAIGGILLATELIGGGGGMSEDQKKMYEQLKGEVTSLQDQLNFQSKWIGGVQEFDEGVTEEWASQGARDAVIENGVALNLENINDLNNRITSLAQATFMLKDIVVKDLDQLRPELLDDERYTNAIWNKTIALHDEVREQLGILGAQSIKSVRFIRDLDIRDLKAAKDLSMRRAIIALYWKMAEIETPRETVPFLSYVGIPPTASVNASYLGTLSGSVALTSVFVMRTIMSAGVPHAQVLNISYVCNPLFLVNNVVSQLSFQSVFDFMGPTGCYNGTAHSQWNCQCVVIVETADCPMVDANNMFPYRWGQAVRLYDALHSNLPAGYESKCQANSIDYLSVEDGRASVYTTPNELAAFLRSACETTVVTDAAYGRDGYPYKARMFAANSFQFVDLTLSDADAGGDVCQPNYTGKLEDGMEMHQMFAYNFMQLLTRAYQISSAHDIPKIEERIFGRIASDLNFQYSPFDSDAQSSQTQRCTGVSHALIHTDPDPIVTKLPVYAHLYSHSTASLEVRVSGEVVQPFNSNGTNNGGGVTTSTPLEQSTSPSTVHTTTRVLRGGTAVNVLKANFNRLGRWRSDPLSPWATWDAPTELLSVEQNVNARHGHLSYILQRANRSDTNETTLLSIQDWIRDYGTFFDSTAIGPDPTRYKRKLQSISETRYACGEAYDNDGVTEIGLYGENTWCNILNHYDVHTDNAPVGQIVFKPHKYTYTATVEVPGGNFVETALSVCPSWLNVSVVAGAVIVTMKSTAPEQDLLRVVVDNPRKDNCRLYDDQAYLSVYNPIVVTVPDADACQPLYLSVSTFDSNASCYRGRGILVQSSHILTGGAGVPGVVEYAVAVVEDDTINDIVSQMIATSDYLNDISSLHYSDATEQEMERQIANLTQQRIDSINNMSLPTKRQIAWLEEQQKKIASEGAQISDNVAKGRANIQKLKDIDAKMAKTLAYLEGLDAVLSGDWDKINASNIAGNKQLADFIASVNKVLADAEKADCDWGPLCGLFNLLGNIFGGGFGGIIKMLLHLALMALGAYLVFKLIMWSIDRCTSSHHHNSTGGELELEPMLDRAGGIYDRDELADKDCKVPAARIKV
jgi:hypothetical protein